MPPPETLRRRRGLGLSFSGNALSTGIVFFPQIYQLAKETIIALPRCAVLVVTVAPRLSSKVAVNVEVAPGLSAVVVDVPLLESAIFIEATGQVVKLAGVLWMLPKDA